MPVPSPKKANGSVHRINRPSTGFEQQGLKQSWRKQKSNISTTGHSIRKRKRKKKRNIQGLWDWGTAEMKDIRPARPKNLATKTVAWPWASEVSIHCKQGRRIQDSLHPFRRTRQPLQLISESDCGSLKSRRRVAWNGNEKGEKQRVRGIWGSGSGGRYISWTNTGRQFFNCGWVSFLFSWTHAHATHHSAWEL